MTASAASPGPDLPAPETRGRTSIADRVVERIAARAVAEVDLATGLRRRIPRPWPGRSAAANLNRLHAEVVDGLVTVRVSVSVRWPAPVRQVTRQVRARVTERVQTLTGMQVGWVDIDVPTLTTADGEAG